MGSPFVVQLRSTEGTGKLVNWFQCPFPQSQVLCLILAGQEWERGRLKPSLPGIAPVWHCTASVGFGFFSLALAHIHMNCNKEML